MTVYIVDDSPMMQARLIELCHSHGVTVVGTAVTYRAALEGIARSRPDVVLLDIRLKEGSGLDVLRVLKSAPASPIVAILTNHVQSKYREASLSLGADHFFHKATEFEDADHLLGQLARRESPLNP